MSLTAFYNVGQRGDFTKISYLLSFRSRPNWDMCFISKGSFVSEDQSFPSINLLSSGSSPSKKVLGPSSDHPSLTLLDLKEEESFLHLSLLSSVSAIFLAELLWLAVVMEDIDFMLKERSVSLSLL